MIENVFLDLMMYIQTAKGSLDTLQNKLDLWKETQLQKTVQENEKRQHYIDTIEVPRKEYEKQYAEYLKTLDHQRNLFMKSTPLKRQALLETWLNRYNEGLHTLQTLQPSNVYTAKQ